MDEMTSNRQLLSWKRLKSTVSLERRLYEPNNKQEAVCFSRLKVSESERSLGSAEGGSLVLIPYSVETTRWPQRRQRRPSFLCDCLAGPPRRCASFCAHTAICQARIDGSYVVDDDLFTMCSSLKSHFSSSSTHSAAEGGRAKGPYIGGAANLSHWTITAVAVCRRVSYTVHLPGFISRRVLSPAVFPTSIASRLILRPGG